MMSRAWSRSASNSGRPSAALPALFDEALLHITQRLLQLRVLQGLVGILGEAMGAGTPWVQSVDVELAASPMAGVSQQSARTSAMWRACTGEPRRFSLPAMFIRQPRSPASSNSAWLASTQAAFSETILLEISGYFTQKVPPKPQQTSASVQLLQAYALEAAPEAGAADP